MPKHTMPGRGGAIRFPGCDEFAATQDVKGSLDRAFGEACGLRDVAEARRDRIPVAARCESIQVQINNERCWMFVMADQVTH
jgi:hypothetical protein